MTNLIIVSLSWIIFGALHSLMLHPPVRKELQEIFESDDQSYRLIYALVSMVSLFICTLLTLLLEGAFLYQPDAFTYTGGGILMLGALYLMKLAFKNYNLMVFIGLQPEPNPKLKIAGLNRHVRHPLYLAAILFFIGMAVFWPSDIFIFSAIILIIYTVIGAKMEERKLISTFGKDYTDYMKEVPPFFPKFNNK